MERFWKNIFIWLWIFLSLFTFNITSATESLELEESQDEVVTEATQNDIETTSPEDNKLTYLLNDTSNYVKNENEDKYKWEVYNILTKRIINISDSFETEEEKEKFILYLSDNKDELQALYELSEKKLIEQNYNREIQQIEEQRIEQEKKNQDQEYLNQIASSWRSNIILYEYKFDKTNVVNWFSNWRCTRYVWTQVFPYEPWSTTNQVKLWTWNARDWYKNAQANWYTVSKSIPLVWSVVVFSWYWYNRLWHVWVVREVYENTIVIEDMKVSKKKYYVTKRVIKRKDPSIYWYIYLK